MLMNILGLIIGFVFMFGAIGFSTILLRHNIARAMTGRKIIHIIVSHWWIIAMIFFNNIWMACIIPFSFIIINALALKFNFFKAMDGDNRLRNLGTVYFPIALLGLVYVCWSGLLPIWVGGMAILVLGWSDGLAALIGQKTHFGEFKIYGHIKSAAGILTMFVTSFIVALVFIVLFSAHFKTFIPAVGASFIVAIVATIAELFAPFGMDNLTVTAAVAGLSAIFLI
jgi:phytol kinase